MRLFPDAIQRGVSKLMKTKQGNTVFTRSERIAVTVFAILFELYVLNALIGKATIIFGWKTYHIGNVGEFLMLLTASVAFIIAALHDAGRFDDSCLCPVTVAVAALTDRGM